MRLEFNSLNHSRTAGMFTVSGKGYLAAAAKAKGVKGIDAIEHDADVGEYVFTYCKACFDQAAIRNLFKSNK